jgi:hypothetical protein
MNLPSQTADTREDRAYERGFLFGRDSVIRRMRAEVANVSDLPTQQRLQGFLNELESTDFRLQLHNVR